MGMMSWVSNCAVQTAWRFRAILCNVEPNECIGPNPFFQLIWLHARYEFMRTVVERFRTRAPIDFHQWFLLCAGLACVCDASLAVGTPVTRRPRHRPRRAVFPHPVPRLYSLSREREVHANTTAARWLLGDTGSAMPSFA